MLGLLIYLCAIALSIRNVLAVDIKGSPGFDTMKGTATDDDIRGLNGDDIIDGLDGVTKSRANKEMIFLMGLRGMITFQVVVA
jgi:hypothetical protein